MTLTLLLQTMLARKKLFLRVLATVVLVVATITLILPKTYLAEVTLIADQKGTDVVSGTAMPSQLLTSHLATQIEVISSRSVALKVVEALKLAEGPLALDMYQAGASSSGSVSDWLADKLRSDLSVKPGGEGNIFTISFAASDPDFTARVANAFAEAYIQTSIELKLDPARRQSAWFAAQLQEQRKALETAQQRLSEFQKSNSLVGSDERMDVEGSKLIELGNQLVTTQATMYDALTRQKQMSQALEHGQVEELPDILGNALLQGMKADLVRAEGKLSDISERYGRNHPQYLSAAAEVRTLKEKLATELRTASGSVSQSAQIAQQRVAEAQRALDEQKQRILALKRQRDELDVLSRDVESAQRAYDATAQRANSVHLESQLDQSNVAVLSPATRPREPASPRLAFNLIVALIIGAMLGAGWALAAELIEQRLRTANQVTDVTGLPVLAELGRPTSQRRRQTRLRASSEPEPLPKVSAA